MLNRRRLLQGIGAGLLAGPSLPVYKVTPSPDVVVPVVYEDIDSSVALLRSYVTVTLDTAGPLLRVITSNKGIAVLGAFRNPGDRCYDPYLLGLSEGGPYKLVSAVLAETQPFLGHPHYGNSIAPNRPKVPCVALCFNVRNQDHDDD